MQRFWCGPALDSSEIERLGSSNPSPSAKAREIAEKIAIATN